MSPLSPGELTVQRDITLEQLRVFVCVAECGGFGRAADTMGRTQSTLSVALKRLEDSVGHRLLDRRKGHVAGLTDEGARFLPVARDILLRTHRALRALGRPPLEGRLALGVPDDLDIDPLHTAIAHCLAHNPGLRVEITAAASAVLKDRLRAGSLDMAILKRMAGEPLQDGTERPIRTEPLQWVGAATGAVQGRGAGEIALVTFPEDCVIRRAAVAAFSATGRPYYIAYASGSFDNVRKAVAAGLGIALLPSRAVSGDVRVLPDDEAPSVAGAIQLLLHVAKQGSLGEQFARYLCAELSA